MRRWLLGAVAVALGLGTGGQAGTATRAPVAVFAPLPGHRIAGFGFDRRWLALAEDPDTPAGCPVVQLVSVTGGGARSLTSPGGATCHLGGDF